MIYLIGTGPMAQEYARVLVHIGKEFTVIGRGNKSAESFYAAIGVQPITGGLDAYLNINHLNNQDKVIIATSTEALMPNLRKVLVAGAGKVLIEKPAAISIDELLENEEFLKPYGEKVFVAYNRRFYTSVIEAMKLIDEDGGLESMHFEFTEWVHKIEPLEKAPGVKENWFFANSTHVVDLAFFIAGMPDLWNVYSKQGKLGWHPITKYVGAGVTQKGVLFSYHSNWESAGRWGIELMTLKRKIILSPLEEVKIQWKGNMRIEKHESDLSVDNEFKPGLFKQLKSFLNNERKILCSLSEHILNTEKVYKKINEF